MAEQITAPAPPPDSALCLHEKAEEQTEYVIRDGIGLGYLVRLVCPCGWRVTP